MLKIDVIKDRLINSDLECASLLVLYLERLELKELHHIISLYNLEQDDISYNALKLETDLRNKYRDMLFEVLNVSSEVRINELYNYCVGYVEGFLKIHDNFNLNNELQTFKNNKLEEEKYEVDVTYLFKYIEVIEFVMYMISGEILCISYDHEIIFEDIFYNELSLFNTHYSNINKRKDSEYELMLLEDYSIRKDYVKDKINKYYNYTFLNKELFTSFEVRRIESLNYASLSHIDSYLKILTISSNSYLYNSLEDEVNMVREIKYFLKLLERL